MSPRIMVTGIPSYLSTTISGVEGLQVNHHETMKDWRRKKAFVDAMRGVSNTGNFLIGEGALRALPQSATYLPFWHLHNMRDSKEFYQDVKAKFDVCVFTAANLIRSGLNAAHEAAILERLDLPVVVLGIGIQNRDDLTKPLQEGTQRFLNILRDRNAFVLTRGHETADYLQSIGIKNARPNGCPSMYYAPDNVMRSWERMRGLKLSKQSQFVFSGYLGGENEFESIRDMNLMADTEARYVLQDEIVSYNMGVEGGDDDVAFDDCTGEILAGLSFPHKEKIRPKLRAYAFYNTDQWRGWVSHADFSIQRRFHGAMASMQANVPSLMITLDDRMREMVKYLEFPYIERTEWHKHDDKIGFLNSQIESFDIDTIIGRYAQKDAQFRTNLHDAGLV